MSRRKQLHPKSMKGMNMGFDSIIFLFLLEDEHILFALPRELKYEVRTYFEFLISLFIEICRQMRSSLESISNKIIVLVDFLLFYKYVWKDFNDYLCMHKIVLSRFEMRR
jgi:hypothetical protein